jgi:phage tail sheath protein FI
VRQPVVHSEFHTGANDRGQLIVEIGIAPVKPAEFVIFRIAQFSGGAALNE